MFRYGSRYGIVRAGIEQNRAFATVGLLRQVTEATPIDLVCTYISQTQQPWGLKHLVRHLSWDKEDKEPIWKDIVTTRDNKNADRNHIFPDGIVRMSKDYLIRTFWENIDHLRSNACMEVSPYGACYKRAGDELDRGRTRKFPKQVLDALSACHVHHSQRLWDAQHAIGALHAVCTPLMLEPPAWVNRNHGYFCKDDRQFDTLRSNHSRVIASLMTILDSYCWDVKNRNSIPNDAEKNILLDLIECFLVMFGRNTFEDNFRLRQIYEYSRIGDVMSTSVGHNSCGCRCCDRRGEFSDRIGCYSSDFNNGVDSIIHELKHLSPEATICLGSLYDYYSTAVVSPVVLKELRPVATKEVELYLFTELYVQCEKMIEARRIKEAMKDGEFTTDEAYDRCEEPVPCSC